MAEHLYRFGDPVWAKMKGFSAWPGKIEMPPDGMKRPVMKKTMHCVFFFGSHDFAWIVDTDLKPYQDFKNTFNTKKSGAFKKAIDEIEEYIATGKDFRSLSPSKQRVPLPQTPKTPAAGGDDEDDEAEFDALLTGNSNKKPAAKKRQAADSDDESDASGSTTPTTAASGRKPRAKKTRDETSNGSEHDSSHMSNHTSKPKTSAVNSFLDRPQLGLAAPAAVSTSLNNSTQSKTKVEPSTLSFGFMGLGIMGSGMVKNLIASGHKVTVWNRTMEKSKEFVDAGATEALTPGDVVLESDVTFSCVSDPQVAKELIFGNCGVLSEMTGNKAFVEMTGIDADTSQDIADGITSKGGRYLEAQLQGSKEQAADGSLVILVAGDKTLFDDCQSCFQAMGRNSFYLGDVGNACKMNLVLQLMSGVALAGMAEGMALADRAGLQQRDVLEVLELTSLACPLMLSKGKAILEGGFPTSHPLQHMQKDLKLSLNMGDQLEQPLPLTASANEVFKHAKRLGYGEHDSSAVYIRARF